MKEAKIGRAVMDADVFISLNHFKGHEEAGFGGALKNIGMGCGCRAGKMEHAQRRQAPCGPGAVRGLRRLRPASAPTAASPSRTARPALTTDKCVGCGRCIGVCPWDAIRLELGRDGTEILNRKIAEYAQAVVDGRPCFHISLVIDVSPNCDCHPENDAAIVPDVGMFASFDPVALDMACADAVNAQPPLPGAAAAGDPAAMTTSTISTRRRTG